MSTGGQPVHRPWRTARAGAVVPESASRLAARQHRRPAVMQEPVLVLNATFEPINVTAVRRALVLLLKGVAQAEESNTAQVHSTSKSVQVPSVIFVGAKSQMQDPARVAAASDKLNIPIVTFANSGHYPFIDESDRFAQETLTFFRTKIR